MNKVVLIQNAAANLDDDIVMTDNAGGSSTSNTANPKGSQHMVLRIQDAAFKGKGIKMTSETPTGVASASTGNVLGEKV